MEEMRRCMFPLRSMSPIMDVIFRKICRVEIIELFWSYLLCRFPLAI